MHREPSSTEKAERLRRAEEAEVRLMQPIVSIEPVPRTPVSPAKPVEVLSPAQKAARTRRLKRAAEAARNTDKWTETLCKALAGRVRGRWHFVSFRGRNGGEWKGVVDVLAIRKNTAQPAHPRLKPGDLFEMILVQMKGGSARDPDAAALERLLAVKDHYGAKEVVLFRWKKGQQSSFSKLTADGWKDFPPERIFGKNAG